MLSRKIICLCLLAPGWSLAQGIGVPSTADSPPQINARSYFSFAVKGVKGSSSSDDNKYVKGRDLLMYGGDMMLGVTSGNFVLAAAGEYNLWNQRTKPSEVSNTNMSGTQVNVGPALGMSFGRFLLLGKYYAYSKMNLTRKNIDDETVAYTTPSMESFAVQLSMRMSRRTFVGVEYGQVTYKKYQQDGSETKFKADERIKFGGWGVLCGIKF